VSPVAMFRAPINDTNESADDEDFETGMPSPVPTSCGLIRP
jgi:hypothetical protein